MKERPIPFSAPMVRALLAGTKTQTRRAVREQFAADAIVSEVAATSPEGWQVSGHSGLWWDDAAASIDDAIRCPYGQPGDRLWVREAFRTDSVQDKYPPRDCASNWPLWFEADGTVVRSDRVANATPGKLRPGMFMPRWASRITLEVTGVHVERLQDISEADAVAEGVANSLHLQGGRFARENYAHLWWEIHGDDAWDANPWVWVVEFKRVDGIPS